MFVGLLVTPLEKSATGKKMQHAKSVTGEECKTKTLQRVKVQHEIEQYLKGVQHESASWKDYYIEKCRMEMVQ